MSRGETTAFVLQLVHQVGTFEFANETRWMQIYNGDILVSYDTSSLFTDVPSEKTIQILSPTKHTTWTSAERILLISWEPLPKTN